MSVISRFRWLTSLVVALTLSLVFVFSPLFVLSSHAQTLSPGTTVSATSAANLMASPSSSCSRCCSGDMDKDEGCQCCSRDRDTDIAGGRASEDAFRSLVISEQWLGTTSVVV